MSSSAIVNTTTTAVDLRETTNAHQLARGDASQISRGGATSLSSPAAIDAGRRDGGSGNPSAAAGGAGGDGEIVTASNSQAVTQNDTFWHFLTSVLGLMTLTSFVVIFGRLLNRKPIQPALTTIFFWSTLFLIAVVRKLQRRAAQAEATANEEALGRDGIPRVLEKAARQALLAYFTFNHSEDEHKGPKGDAAEIEEGTTTTNGEGPQGSAHPDIMEKGSARMDSSKWVTTGTCIICLGEYRLGDRLCRMPCQHVYHAMCIDEWLDRAKQPCCPLCKNDLRREFLATRGAAVVLGPSEVVRMDDAAGIEAV